MVVTREGYSQEQQDEEMNQYQTDDVRILEIKELVSPDELIGSLPITEAAAFIAEMEAAA